MLHRHFASCYLLEGNTVDDAARFRFGAARSKGPQGDQQPMVVKHVRDLEVVLAMDL